MDDENIEVDTTQNLERYLTKAERFNELLSRNLQTLEKHGEKISNSLPKITLEVEELKKARESLASFLADQMHQVYLKESEAFSGRFSSIFLEKVEDGLYKQKKKCESSLKEIQNSFHEQIQKEQNEIKQGLETHHAQAQELSQKYQQDAEAFKQEMDKAVGSMTRLMSLQKQRLTYRGLLICGVFCLTSFLTGAGLFYFFPQHVYNPDQNTVKYLTVGKIVRDNYVKLSIEDKRLILDAMKKYIEKK